MFDLLSAVPEEKLDDAGILAWVLLLTIAVGGGLWYTDRSLLLVIPAFLVLMVAGELAARKLAALKERQMYGGDGA